MNEYHSSKKWQFLGHANSQNSHNSHDSHKNQSSQNSKRSPNRNNGAIVFWGLKIASFILLCIFYIFSLQVYYVHDGSESSPDAIIFEIELKSGSSDLPREMRIRQRFRLQISIRPVNDPPQIGLTVKSLKIAEGTAKVLTDDLIKVVDPDNSPSEIVVSLVPARDEAVPGHIQNERFPGQARDSFSLEDLFQGRVSFVHHVS